MAAKKKAPAKRGASRYQAAPRKPVPGWIWLVCGLVIGGFVVMLMNLEPGGNEIQRERAEVKRTPPKVNNNEQAKPKFDFYTLLPESEVIVPPDALPAPTPVVTPQEPKPVSAEQAAKIDAQRAEAALAGLTPPPPPVIAKPVVTPSEAPRTQYFLQAGSFRQLSEADRMRAQLILLGQNGKIESGTVRNELWHRVLVGPFASKEQVTNAQRSLAASGFNNLLVQQRQQR